MGAITIKGYRCERCGHQWTKRSDAEPNICPRCKSRYWNEEDDRKIPKGGTPLRKKRKWVEQTRAEKKNRAPI